MYNNNIYVAERPSIYILCVCVCVCVFYRPESLLLRLLTACSFCRPFLYRILGNRPISIRVGLPLVQIFMCKTVIFFRSPFYQSTDLYTIYKYIYKFKMYNIMTIMRTSTIINFPLCGSAVIPPRPSSPHRKIYRS